MTTNNTTPVNSFKTEITALLDSAINTADKSNGIAAKLAVVLWNAANTQEVDSVKLLGYAGGGWSKTAKGEYVLTMATEYSASFRDATDKREAARAEKNETKKREMRDLATRRINAAEQMLRRSLLIAAWFHYAKPVALHVKNSGAVRIDGGDNAELTGEYTLRSLEDLARKHFRPDVGSNASGKAHRKTQDSTDSAPVPSTNGASLRTCAEYVANSVAGRDPGSLGKDLDAVLQTTLATLLGYCGAVTAKGLDLKAVDRLYKASAA